MLGLLSAQLVLLRAQLGHVGSQDRTTRVLFAKVLPALNQLPDSLRALTPVLQAATRAKPVETAATARRLAAATEPVVEEISRTGLIGALTELARTAPAALSTAPQLLSLAQQLARIQQQALEYQRLTLERQTRSLSTQLRSLSTQQRSLSTQQSSLAIQRQTLSLIRQSLAIQQELLQHARSLDRKVP